MSTQVDTDSGSTSNLALRPPQNDQTLKYSPDYLSDADLSSDDDEQPENDDEPIGDPQSIISVSISRQQTRLASPETPAAEKAAALDAQDGEFFGGAFNFDGPSTTEGNSSVNSFRDANDSPSTSTARINGGHQRGILQTLWSSEVSQQPSSVDVIEAVSASCPRGSTPSERNPRRLGPFSLPNWLSSSDGDHISNEPQFVKSKRGGGSFLGFNYARSEIDLNEEQQGSPFARAQSSTPRNRLSMTPEEQAEPDVQPILLRRYHSDESLFLKRSKSQASSLGDDSRWANVHEQVNSRFKAFRDSFQDSSLKLPKMPALPNFNLSGTRQDSSGSKKLESIGSHRDLFQAPIRASSPFRMLNGTRTPTTETARAAAPGMSKAKVKGHPHFSKALKHLKGDVVLLGGYRGSVLRSAEPPNRQVWVPIKVGLNIRKVNLEVGLNPEDDEQMEKNIYSSGMLTNIGPVDISRRLLKKLRHSRNGHNGDLRVHDYGYDWRLNPLLLSKRLEKFLESLPSNSPDTAPSERGALVIAHSLGGMITRHVVNRRPELFSGVLYAGVPQTCVNILGPLRNGDDVFMSSRVLTAQVNFSIRTSYALLPLDGRCFFNPETKEEYRVDFFDPKTWDEHRLTPCIARCLVPSAQPSLGVVGSLVNSMASVLPSISLPASRKSSLSKRKSSALPSSPSSAALSEQHAGDNVQTDDKHGLASKEAPISYHLGPTEPGSMGYAPETAMATAVTIPKEEAVTYLTRTLADVKKFKQELDAIPSYLEQGTYPPCAVMYGKSIPTVYGAKVRSREAIKNADAYDNLAFASGDGVVLARAAQLPEGYQVVRGGVVSSDRGHISLLGDLEAVGKCLRAIMKHRPRQAGSDSGEVEVP